MVRLGGLWARIIKEKISGIEGQENRRLKKRIGRKQLDLLWCFYLVDSHDPFASSII
jgi:hypothetical protein